MQNFIFHNPVKIVFGRGSIAELPKLIPADAKVLEAYAEAGFQRAVHWLPRPRAGRSNAPWTATRRP